MYSNFEVYLSAVQAKPVICGALAVGLLILMAATLLALIEGRDE